MDIENKYIVMSFPKEDAEAYDNDYFTDFCIAKTETEAVEIAKSYANDSDLIVYIAKIIKTVTLESNPEYIIEEID